MRGFVHIFLVITLGLIIGVSTLLALRSDAIAPTIDNIISLVSPTPTPYQFPYKVPEIKKNQSYRMILVGDSIVETLGPNANVLREKLIEHYPDSEFVNYNYGYGATNVLSLFDRLTVTTKHQGVQQVPILKQGIELIIIESFAYNPLSEFPMEEGLQKQNEVLEKSVREILREKPETALAFMTPIAPSMEDFAKGAYDLNNEERRSWVLERIAYMDNHRKFAEEKGIPVIDVYKASLNPDGSANKLYISNDFIHPSKEGIEFISQEIADYIYENEIFPR